jgi:sugar transferase (PEP-CTERM/EpsH1 system associated)
MPYPLSDGGKLRVFNQIKGLSEKHNVISLSFIGSEKELENIDELKKFCKVKTVVLKKYQSYINSFFGLFSLKPLRVWYLRSRCMREQVKEIIKEHNIGVILIQAIRMAQYLPENFKCRKILDIVDTPSLQIERAVKYEKSLIWKLLNKIELPRLKKYEQKIIKNFDRVIVISSSDKNSLSDKAIIIENGINQKIKPVKKTGSNIIFLGNLEYPPNVEAVLWFAEKIFPEIKKPVKFYIVGKNPPKKIRKLAGRNIIVTGFVKNLEPYFSKCSIAVAPLRTGSGLQNKVLEYMLSRTPVIATKIANEGIKAEPDKEILIANNEQEFIEKISLLLKDKNLRDCLSSNAFKFVKKFDWNKLNHRLEKLL